MGKDTHDLGESVELQQVQEFECIHLEAVTSVDHENHHVGHLGEVSHRVDVVTRTLEESESLVLPRHDCDRAFGIHEVLTGVYLDQRPNEEGLPHSLGELRR